MILSSVRYITQFDSQSKYVYIVDIYADDILLWPYLIVPFLTASI